MPRPVSNPPNPWHSSHVEYLGEPPPAALEVFEEESRSLLVSNDSPDVGFTWSINPYRGCYHGCAYCYARPSHQYLGFGAGTDFERKIVVKTNAPSLLRRELARPSWQGELIAVSGNTDCYQPLEASYRLTRACLEVCREFKNPVGLITKGALIRRDVDLLGAMAREAHVGVSISIPFADEDTARKIEPYASRIADRFAAMRALSDAGVRTGINIAPVIPGLNDEDIPELLERAQAAGARRAHVLPVRLAAEVLPVFRERIARELPDERVRKIEHAIQEMRGGHGKMNETRFGLRMHGEGARWAMIESLFRAHCKRLGFNQEPWSSDVAETTFRRPEKQRSLF